MTQALTIPISQISFLHRPPEQWLMAVLKAYLDDSGDQTSAAIAVGGYVGNLKVWEKFETAWGEALDSHKIPYFHLSEICDRESHMHRFYGKPGAALQKALMIDLTKAVSQCWALGIQGVGALVPLEDLAKFNRERGRKIEALPLAIFSCIHIMQMNHPGITIEALLDQITKAESRIAKAKEYLATFPMAKGNDFVSVVPAKGSVNTQTVKALQAADLAAYEIFRAFERIDPFIKSLDKTVSYTAMEMWYEHETWLERNSKPSPNRRNSLLALSDAAPFDCPIWTYEALCSQDDDRGGRWR